MRIGIDISSATATRTGIGHYTYELVRHFITRPEHQVVLMFNSLRQEVPWLFRKHRKRVELRHRRIPGPALLFGWKHLDWPPVEVLCGSVDVFHSPSTYIPPQRRGVAVTTVHDLHFLDTPDKPAGALAGTYIAQALQKRLSRVDALICPSQLTADAVTRHFGGIAPAIERRIHVIPWGVHKRFFRAQTDSNSRIPFLHFGLDSPCILYVGGAEPRKNLPGLIRAHDILCSRMPDAPMLVIAGPNHDASITSQSRSGKLRVLKYVYQNELPQLYQTAALFVCPSLLEGFGMPILEAMAAGVPVVSTPDAGCIESTGSDSVLAADTRNPEALAEAMHRALTDQALRQSLITRGIEAAGRLTWRECARRTMEVYRKSATA